MIVRNRGYLAGIITVLAACANGQAMASDEGIDEKQNGSSKPGAVKGSSDLVEVNVWGRSYSADEAGYTNPNSILLPQDMASINAVTTEDLVKFEPSLVIRRRFIGDSNGTLGMRGSNMFQTSRSMVFADGVPLHYLLQSRWSGAPRWTMVSASEIEKVEVLYGPFSAEYSGNSMGGVVLIETGIPQQREVHADISSFTQEFDAYGFDGQESGYKGFLSYGDKVGDLSYYLSFNRLDNNAQPQTFRGTSYGEASASASKVSGALVGEDAQERSLIFYGDTGVVNTVTNNYKFKLGYDWGNWRSLLNVAFEDRGSENVGSSYIRDENGNTLWSGSTLDYNGSEFNFNSGRLNASLLDRESLSLGIRLKGDLSDESSVEVNLNQFDILTDQSRSSSLNPNDPLFDGSGRISDYENSGWQTADIKFTQEDFLLSNLQWVSGLRHENYELNMNQFNSPDYFGGIKGDVVSRFGGKTEINAAFTQFNWDLNEVFDLAFGLRYEQFESSDGYFNDDDSTTPQLDLSYAPAVKDSKFSPKLSLGYQFASDWLLRYSVGKAYRFPIVEELFRQYEAYNSINEANPELKPENGTHHNIMIERTLSAGYIRVNIFQDDVKNAIESQSATIIGGPNDGASVSTFVPLDETRARGVEFIVNQYDIFLQGLDIRFNVTYTDSEVVKNTANREWEGNTYPRLPEWRSNLLAMYHLNSRWDLGLNVQYASDSYGRIDNDDTVDNVYGAQDAYTRIGLKAQYQFSDHLAVSAGLDNLTNEVAYVAHPWPGRTAYLSFKYDM